MKGFLFSALLLLAACCGSKQGKATTGSEADTTSVNTTQVQQNQATIKQGIAGRILWESGNRMPSPDAPPTESKRGVQRTVYIYELTNANQVTTQNGVFHTNIQTKLVAEVATDANGNFSVALKPGKYSLFTKEEKGLYANLFDGEMNIFPVEVKDGQVSTIEFLVNYQASY
ncbi:carboxypeptidase regulatory-like domain-containing protein [Pontibacter pudoricolor]|uniref:carboxypeptidase regulatory-like domain-containing protein n=1 Tax=Pontibacter pudoricolor TaxID=2694930 RepID=UPI001EE491B4|nr:carboxypeptidase regulatory-like domain-containing protein [Pontibacter pudoricolor]